MTFSRYFLSKWCLHLLLPYLEWMQGCSMAMFRLDSCWTIARNKIYNINTAFCVFIGCLNLWLPSSVFHHSDIIMHWWQHNHLLLSTLLFIYIQYQHQIIIFTMDGEGGLFIVLDYILYFSWNTFPIKPYGTNNGNVSFWTPLSQWDRSKISIHRDVATRHVGNGRNAFDKILSYFSNILASCQIFSIENFRRASLRQGKVSVRYCSMTKRPI